MGFLPDFTDDNSTTSGFDIEGNPISSDVAYSASGGGSSSGDTSLFGILGFDPNRASVDPTNTGDTGAFQNTSTPSVASQNNPETAGGSSLGSVLNNVLNTGFAAWQLSSQPQGTPRTISTQVGTTRVISGAPASGIFSGALGSTVQQQQSTLLLIVVAVIVFLFFKYRS